MWRSCRPTAETICSGAGVPGTIGEATSQNHRRYRLIHENDPTTNQSEIETRRTAARATPPDRRDATTEMPGKY